MNSPGHTFFLAYTIAFSVFAAVVLLQFVRKRNSMYLRDRFPYVSLLQLVASAVGVGAFAVVLFAENVDARCVADLVVSIVASNIVFLAMFIRIWGLYWRIYLGKHLAEFRRHLHEELSIQSTGDDVAVNRTVLQPRQQQRRASLSQAAPCCCCCLKYLSKKWVLRVMKYALPLLFGTIACFHTLACVASVLFGICDSYGDGETFNILQILVAPIVSLVGILSAVVAFSIRRFHDNVGVNTEIKRLFVTQLVIIPVSAVMLVVQVVIGGLPGLQYIVASLFLQLVFVVSGFFPLRDQRRLEIKVRSADFGDLTSFESVLHDDAAALVAFERFMRREFCEELLEFSKAVTRYRDAHTLSTRERQRAMARVIFAQFVAADAPAQINVSGPCRGKIAVTLFESASVKHLGPGVEVRHAPLGVFDDAQAEMHKLVREGPFIRFQIHVNDQVSEVAKKEDTRKPQQKTGSTSKSPIAVVPRVVDSDSAIVC